MKRLLAGFLTSVLLLILAVGCTTTIADVKDNSDKSAGSTAGSSSVPVTVPFDRIDEEDLHDDTVRLIEGLKHQRGHYVLEQEDNSLLLFIGAGEKPTGGYDIEAVTAVEKDGDFLIVIEETEPGKDDMVIMVLTYPYTVIRINHSAAGLAVMDEDDNRLNAIEGPGYPNGPYADGVFDARSIHKMDLVGSMLVEDVDVLDHGDDNGYSAQVTFSGIVTVSGRFVHYKQDEVLGDVVAFYVDAADAHYLPRLENDDRILWFVFTNTEEAEAMLGESGSEGAAVVEIDRYTIHYAPSDVYNTALLLGVIYED